MFYKTHRSFEICQIIRNRKNITSTGKHEISTKVLNHAYGAVSPSFKLYPGLGIEQGILPKVKNNSNNAQKVDNINFGNYSLIALSPILSKIFEKVILITFALI